MINIDNNWRVRTDAYNYIPERFDAGGEEYRNPRTGKVAIKEAAWRSIDCYYGTLQGALYGIMKWEKLNLGTQKVDLQGYIEQLEQLQDKLLAVKL